MTDEKWENIINLIADKFGVKERKKEALGNEPGEIEIVEFEGPLGKMKLERTTKPMVLDKKTTYSGRVGSSVTVDYVYSETEKVCKFKAYRWDDGQSDWQELTGESLPNF